MKPCSLGLAVSVFASCAPSSPPGRYCRVDNANVCWELDFANRKAWIGLNGRRSTTPLVLRPTMIDGAKFETEALGGVVLFAPKSSTSIIVKHSGGADDVWTLTGPLSPEPKD